jgi:hypothetical protein
MAAPATVEEVEAACAAFVQATDAQSRAEAERRLLAFRAGPDPLPVSVALLELSRSPHAQFHGLGTLRERAHGQWPALDASARDMLQLRLLQLIAGGASGTPARVANFVMREAAQVAALLAKLALLDAATAAAGVFSSDGAGGGHDGGGAGLGSLLGRVSELIAAADTSHAVVGVHILESMVLEFGSPSGGATGGGLRWAEHALARRVFGRNHLLPAFYTALRALERIRGQLSPPAGAPPTSARLGMSLPPSMARMVENCASVLGLMLSWDFDSGPAADADASDGESRPGLNATVVRPPAEAGDWPAVLGRTELLSCAVEVYAAAARGGPAFSDARHALRQLLIMLASVSHRVFSGDGGGRYTEYAMSLLSAAAALLSAHPLVLAAAGSGAANAAGPLGPLGISAISEDPADVAEEHGCSLLDASGMLQRLVMAGGVEPLAALPPDALYLLLANAHNGAVATARAAADAAASPTYERTGEADAHDVLVEVLASLRLQARGGRAALAGLDDASWRVYVSAVRERRRAACAAAEEEADEEVEEGYEGQADEEERMQTLAALGRARAGEACGLLAAALRECGGKWHALAAHVAAAGGGASVDPAQLASLFEEMVVLLQLSSALLTDPAEGGDASEIPSEIADARREGSAANGVAGAPAPAASVQQHPAVELVAAVLAQLRPQLEAIVASSDPRTGPLAPLLSPLVGMAFLQLGARVAHTYLMPDEAVVSVLPAPLLAEWGRDTRGGAALLSSLAEAAAVFTLRWRGEEELALAGCAVLAAICRRNGAAPLLGQMSCVAQLADMPKQVLPPDATAMLHEALARVALASAQPSDAFGRLCEPLRASVDACAASRQLNGRSAASVHPATIAQVHGVCAGLRGLFRASCRRTAGLSFSHSARCLPGMLGLVSLLESEPASLTPVLLTFRDAASVWMPSLSLPTALHLAQACAAAAAAYAGIVRALPGGEAGGSLPESNRSDQLRALFELVAHVASRDPTEDTLGEGPSAMVASAAAAEPLGEAVAAALHAAIQCVPPTLPLHSPALATGYFGMLDAALSVHSRRTLALPHHLVLNVGGHLAGAIGHYDLAIGRAALETTYQLARHAAMAGGDGGQTPPGATALVEGMLRRVALAVLGDALHPELVDPPAANALLALIAAAPGCWQATVHELMQMQPEAAAREPAAAAFAALFTTNGVTDSLAKPNRMRFRGNLLELLKFTRASRFVVPQLPS